MQYIENGVLSDAQFIPSPNFDDRPPGTLIELLVIHSISLPPGEFGGDGVIDLFTNRLDPHTHPYYASIHLLRVSAHFFIRRDGSLIQFVPCHKRAWHAGISSWQGRKDCNDFSIGIELEGCDDQPFEDAQYAELDRLTITLANVYPITGIAGHCEIAPGRKTDPGPHFDWGRLALSHLHTAHPPFFSNL
ncbi:MAG: 1,6-anhydro-N-acetylmuramyl-L-alanine amidase AmpD [Methylophilaceae bacterium]|nr:1,6-anhydro-N-acetylmuramyl-L-alanine amidase AmpD [Methylophilaceae bacterium]